MSRFARRETQPNFHENLQLLKFYGEGLEEELIRQKMMEELQKRNAKAMLLGKFGKMMGNKFAKEDDNSPDKS